MDGESFALKFLLYSFLYFFVFLQMTKHKFPETEARREENLWAKFFGKHDSFCFMKNSALTKIE
jgi:hypothetical protein